MNDKTQNWLGIVLVFWPLVRGLLSMAGVDLPDLGDIPSLTAMPSQAIGATLLARSGPIQKKNKS